MSQSKLMSERRFAPLFWTQFLGAFNDNFLKNALVILIAFQGVTVLGVGPSQMVALAGGIFILPYFLFSATAGQLADRMDKAELVRWVKLVEIPIMIMAGIGFVTHSYAFLLFALFLMGLHSTFFGPIKYSILPQHLREDELVGGNALIEAGTFLAILLGTIAGGVLVSVENGVWIISIALLGIALLGYWTGRKVPPAPAIDPNLVVQWWPWKPTVSILKDTRKNRPVFLSLLGISWFWFFGASMLSLFPVYVKEVLHANAEVVTLFLALFSIGIGVGSMLCEKMSRSRLELGLVPFGSIGMTLFMLDLFLRGAPDFSGLGPWAVITAPDGLHLVLDLFFISIFGGFYIVPLYTMMQERSEPSHRSRVIAANNILNALFMVVASVCLIVFMALGLSVPQIFLVLAILNGAVSLYIYTVLPEFLFRFVLWIVGNLMYRVKVEGTENIPNRGAALLIANHVSFVDWMLIAVAVSRPPRFVMDHTYAKGGLMRMLFNHAKVIRIATMKESPAMMEKAFDQVSSELRDQELVFIFPEGKITKDGKLNPFRPGTDRVLSRDPVPVIPIAIGGMWGSFFSREGGRAVAKLPRRFWSRVTVKIGKPIPAAEANPARLYREVCSLLEVDPRTQNPGDLAIDRA